MQQSELLSCQDVMRLTGIRSRATIWRRIKKGTFPNPVDIGSGRIRWRGSGSAGGQKGLNDIIQRLGTERIPRLRIGIDRPGDHMDSTAWVLSRFRDDERELMDPAIERAADSIEVWIRDGLEAAMNQFNLKT